METALSLSLALLIFLTLGILIASRQQFEDRRLLIKFFVFAFLLRVIGTVFVYLYLSINGHEGGFYPHPDPPFPRLSRTKLRGGGSRERLDALN